MAGILAVSQAQRWLLVSRAPLPCFSASCRADVTTVWASRPFMDKNRLQRLSQRK